jgi:hypothetical protein
MAKAFISRRIPSLNCKEALPPLRLTRPESAQITRDKSRARQLGFPGLHDLLGLFRRDLLQDPLDALRGAGVLEPLHDRCRGKIYEKIGMRCEAAYQRVI